MAAHLSTEGLGGSIGTDESGEQEPPSLRCEGGCGTWLSKQNRKRGASKLCFRCQAKALEQAEEQARLQQERELQERQAKIAASKPPLKPRQPRKPPASPPPDPITTEAAVPVPVPGPPAIIAANDVTVLRPRERMIVFLIKVIRGR